jgi:hypothetical protein
MGTPEQKQNLAVLEETVLGITLKKLADLVAAYAKGNYVVVNRKRCPLLHIEEMVKLAHRARSIMNPIS